MILLNDKSDFPRLSPRPSLLNLVDKTERRKSMQPGIQVNERELFLNTKDASKRGILKSRARSNSESGRGTLSSPEDGPGHQNSFGDGAGYSGLSTPIIINRKSSLNSPMMVNHIRNILNSLEDKVNQMNGSCNRSGGGRGSVDTDSIPEDAEGECAGHEFGRRVDSIEEQTEGPVDYDSSAMSYASKRRASLQPQKCVDEDDDDGLVGDRTLLVSASHRIPAASNKQTGSVLSAGGNANSAADSTGASPTIRHHQFIPTTIQIDPPSIHSNYSLSSSASSNSNSSNQITPIRQPMESDFTAPQTPRIIQIDAHDKQLYPLTTHSRSGVTQNLNPPSPTTKVATIDSYDPQADIAGQKRSEKIPSSAVANFKPKTLRTPSDVENQNNLTFSESTDISDSQSNELGTRDTYVEECEDNFDHTNGVAISDIPDPSISWKNCPADITHPVVHVTHHTDNTRSVAAPGTTTNSPENSRKSSLNSVNDRGYQVLGSSVDPPECDKNYGSVYY